MRRASFSPLRICPRSRGLPRPATIRPSARPRSGRLRIISRSSARLSGSTWSHCTSARRASMALRSSNGAARSSASNRAPAPVTQRSIAPIRLPSRCPDWLESISRLERVASSMAMVWPASRLCGGNSRGSVPRPTCSRYSISPPAAASMAREKSPKPSSVATACTRWRLALPFSLSNSDFARGMASSGPNSAPSGTTHSLKVSLASAASRASSGHSSSTICPVEMSQLAMPMVPRTSAKATSRLARRGSSKASSVSVPAVTNRTMSRFTKALLTGLPSALARAFDSSGVSTCSAIATRHPALINRARYPSAECTGTPHIGIGSPPCSPRLVSAISSTSAATFASSKNSSKKSPMR